MTIKNLTQRFRALYSIGLCPKNKKNVESNQNKETRLSCYVEDYFNTDCN